MRLFRSHCLVAIFGFIILSTILAVEGKAQTVPVDIEGQVTQICTKYIYPIGEPAYCASYVANSGLETLTVNGINVSALANMGTTAEDMASQLAQEINTSVPNVSASYNGNFLYITPLNPFTFTLTPTQLFPPNPTFGFLPFTFDIYPPIAGIINPKYLVLAVTYAPPGQNSSVNYGSSTMFGTSTSMTNSFQDGNTVSVSLSRGFGIFGINANTTDGASDAFTQQSDSTSSITVNKTSSSSFTVPGPASSANGVDHDYDIVWIWVNPRVHMSITPEDLLEWNGFSYDARDPAGEIEVVPLYVTWLRNPATIPADVAAVLARTWDPSGLGGLTNDDYAEILKCDPFSDPSYVPDPARFDIQGGQTFAYEPPPPGGQPITQTYSLTYQMTSSTGTSGQTSHKVGFSTEETFTGGFFVKFMLKLKEENTMDWTDKWSSTSNSQAGQTASMTIKGPAYTDNYTGPTEIQVYKDNVYGTFMFYPIPH